MPAYLIARVDITDLERYPHYLKATPPIIEKFGGKAIYSIKNYNTPARKRSWSFPRCSNYKLSIIL